MSDGGGVLYLGIDLAERHSAAVLSDESDRMLYYSFLDAGQAIPKEDGGPLPQVHLRALARWWQGIVRFVREEHPEQALGEIVCTVENIFPHAMNGIPAARMQGGLHLLALSSGIRTQLVLGNVWQNALGFSKKEHGDTKKWARWYAETFTPFEMPEAQMDGSRLYAKQKVDLPDAFLINHWRRTVFDA